MARSPSEGGVARGLQLPRYKKHLSRLNHVWSMALFVFSQCEVCLNFSYIIFNSMACRDWELPFTSHDVYTVLGHRELLFGQRKK